MEPVVAVALQAVPDDELLLRLAALVSQSRRVEADLVAHIGEADERRLYARQAFPSMFAYCTQALHLSEAEAYRRITVARAARRQPELLAALRDGRLHLSGLALLVPLLTADNCVRLLERAERRSKREIEELVAELAPRPDLPSVIRKLPRVRVAPRVPPALASPTDHRAPADTVEPAPGSDRILPAQPDTPPSELFPGRVERRAVAFQSSRPSVAPLSPARYRVQFTASAELRNKLERLKDLMRHEVPDGDLGAIVERAVTEKLERLEARRFAKTAAPRPAPTVSRKAARSRHIPAAVRRAAIARVGMQCGFVDALGRRCRERDRLEFHHRHPFGMGGEHSASNIGLLCSAHNRLMAERDYGTAAIEPAARHHRSG